MSAAIKHRRRTCQFDCESGKGKTRPNTTYPNSKEEEKAILNARIQIHERVTEPNGGRRPIDELLCACMHARALCAAAAAAVHAFSVNSANWARVTFLVAPATKKWLSSTKRTTNQRSKRSKFGEEEACQVWCKPARLTTFFNWRHFGLQ